MIKCQVCGQDSVIKVAEKDSLDLFSCCNEECADHAELLVETNGGYEHVYKMIHHFKEIVEEINSEKTEIPRG